MHVQKLESVNNWYGISEPYTSMYGLLQCELDLVLEELTKNLHNKLIPAHIMYAANVVCARSGKYNYFSCRLNHRRLDAIYWWTCLQSKAVTFSHKL